MGVADTDVVARRLDIRRKFLELENLQNERLFVSINGNPPESEWHIDDSPEALMRDRYSNIHAWERNRIHLDVPPEHSDYINASPIALASRKDGSMKRYIAMQVWCGHVFTVR